MNSQIKYITAILLVFVLCPMSVLASDQVGDWHVYQAYTDITEVEVAEPDSLYFAIASSHLYRYDIVNGEVEPLSRETGLSGSVITHIVWCEGASRLVVVYDNSDIDLVDLMGNVTNMPDLMNRVMSENKIVTGTCAEGQMAYLTTSFGILQIDVANASFVTTHDRNSTIGKWALSQPQRRNDSSKLPDVDDPAHPHYNSFYHVAFADGRLYSVPGAYNAGRGYNYSHAGAVQVFDPDSQEWSMLDASFADTLSHRFIDYNVISVDPTDPKHFAVGAKSGLYEYRDDMLCAHYSVYNSPITSATGALHYCVIEGLAYDSKGNLWLANWGSTTKLLCLTNQGEWYVSDKFGDITYRGLRDFMFDSRGYLWMVNEDWNDQSIICYSTATNEIQKFTSLINQNGSGFGDQWTQVRSLAEDHLGRIWVGTKGGPAYIEPSQIYSGDQTLHQYIIARNDGSGLGDYMLSGLDITCMCFDRAGRKWFGTLGNGVYLMSADCNTQLAHFTTQNSLLPSDDINHISIDPLSGCVYFATQQGLASYQSEITPGVEEYDKIYCYPNPVRPEFTGVLTICNLHEGSNVTITDALHRPLYRTQTFSGTITWRPVGIDGDRLSPGIYFIYQTDSDGKDGGICKFLVM